MGPAAPLSDIDPAVARRAVEWLVELQSGTADEAVQRAHRAWLDQHAEHRRAWSHIEAVNARLRGSVGAAPVAHALASQRPPQRRRVVSALMLAVAAGAAWQAREPAREALAAWKADLRTGVGERGQWTLDDGSTLALNTDTAVEMRFSAAERRLKLHRGELMVTTGADAGAAAPRPFVVETAHGELRPRGTRFSARVLGDGSQIAVFEGAVAVHPRDASASAAALLPAGERARFTRDAVGPRRAADDADAAWTDGMLVASNMRLDDFLAELARHRGGVLRCDPDVGHLRVSGTYPLADTDRVLALLATTLPVAVETRTRWWVRVKPRSP
jgi:transmembrane sensor